jgi:hypothetical protein
MLVTDTVVIDLARGTNDIAPWTLRQRLRSHHALMLARPVTKDRVRRH